MNTDLVSSLLSARNAQTNQSAMYAVIRKNHEMDMQLVQMVDQAVRSAPPPGQGVLVDKLA